MRKLTDHDLGGSEKYSLAFSYGEIESSHNSENELLGEEIQFLASGCGEGGALRLKEGRIDSCVDHVEIFWGENAGGAMVAFGNGGGGIVVSVEEDLGHEGGDGDHGICGGEEVFSAERGARAFCEVSSEHDKGAGFHEAGSKESGPVVVPVVGVKNPGLAPAKNSSQGEDLGRTKARQGMKVKICRGWGERSVDGPRHF